MGELLLAMIVEDIGQSALRLLSKACRDADRVVVLNEPQRDPQTSAACQ
ncbi:hypothetical protein N1Z41_00035930 [Pseudomonas aeruginosa]